MLLELGLSNFKPFGDILQTAPLSRINLIYGPNSSGKSSILQALLMLKQSLVDRYTVAPFLEEPTGKLIPRGEYVDLGSFSALLHKHDTAKELGIALSYEGYGLNQAGPIRVQRIRAYLTFSPTRHHAHSDIVGLKYDVSHDDVKIFDGEWVSDINASDSVSIRKQLSIADIPIPKEMIAISHLGFLPYLYVPGLTPEPGVAWQEASKRKEVVDLKRRLEHKLTPDLMDLVRNMHSLESYFKALHSVTYLGPLRSHPERIYTLSGKNRHSIGVRGEFTPDFLYSNPETVQKANAWFQRFEMPYELVINKFGDEAVNGEYVSLNLVDKQTGTLLTLADVGFGINQLLPVIVEGLSPSLPKELGLPDQSIVCVEQPEIHLHPRLQAQVADLMIETSKGRQGKQWIVETHSELLIRRIQRRIEEGELGPADVSVIYVNPGEGSGSRIETLRLDTDGDFIDDWPNGFFEEGYNEVMGY